MSVAEPFKPAPYPLNTMNVMTPFCFKDWVEKQKPALVSGQPLDMFGIQFETEVRRKQCKLFSDIKVILIPHTCIYLKPYYRAS